MGVRVCFDGEMLQFRPAGGAAEERRVAPADLDRLAKSAAAYDTALKTRDPTPLAGIGRDLFDWLDGDRHWLNALRDGAGPRELTIEVRAEPGEAERRLLDAPWELLADGQGFLAANEARPLVLCRRLGRPDAPADPAHADLLLMFMAAAPRGDDTLDYEFEESGILRATERLPLQLRVEESGCLEFLEDRIALEAPVEALHLSCHGTIKAGGPLLILEDRLGDRRDASPPELARALGDRPPPLVFLSACRTAEQSRTAPPLALTLVRAGVGNVLGWDGSVYDTDASLFAHAFYHELARRRTAAYAAGVARQTLLRAYLDDPRPGVGHHWHLARVYLGARGGGPVCANGRPLRRLEQRVGYSEFLDKERQQVPVASALSFVGRRREAQAILRAFAERTAAGVLIHGMGRLGKSSLAARIANRLPRHKTVVVFRDYRAKTVLDTVLRALPVDKARELRATWEEPVEKDPAALSDALRAVLEGPCAVADSAANCRPILLVIDDLEQILERPRPGEPAVKVKADHVPALSAIIEAFADARTDSYLLLTSRYRFALSDRRGRDLAARLEDRQLPPMTAREQAKQLRAERALGGDGAAPPETGEDQAGAALLARCVAAAKGNPGLQTRLTTAVLTDPVAAEAAVAAAERFHASGEIPTGADIGEFFEQLTLGVYRDALTPDEKALVRAALLFELPVPATIMAAAGRAAGVDAPEPALARVCGLGLVDVFAPASRTGEPALLPNALARPLFEPLAEGDRQYLARAVVRPLADAWRGSGGELPYGPAALELVRLAELAGDAPELLAEAALAGGRWLFLGEHDASAALAVAEPALAALEAAGLPPSAGLLRLAAEAAERLGEADKQERFLQSGLTREGDKPGEQAGLWLRWAELLIRKGDIDEAETWLKQAERAFAKAGDVGSVAASRGYIADILAARGELDEALRIRREEELPVYRRLGDVRSVAVTQGSIADILFARGELDEALRIRREEELPVFERLGDVREIAVTQGKVADILAARGELDEALRIQLEERLPLVERLGDPLNLAHLRFAVARLRLAKGIESADDLKVVLDDLAQSYGLLRKLGRPDGIAAVGWQLGQLLAQLDQAEPAREVLAEVRAALLKLGRAADAAAVADRIAQLGG